jgi:hypothetical protein
MSYADFKTRVRKAYPEFKITFTSNGAQHMAVVGELTLYMNAGSEAIYGVVNGISIGRAIGVE